MMNRVAWLCLALVAFAAVSHGDHHIHGTSEAALILCHDTAQFTLDLYKQLLATSYHKNIFFSPVGISSLFSLLSLGAKSNTHTQILDGLRFNLTHIKEKDIHKGFHELFQLLTYSDNEIKLDIGQALFFKEDKQLLPGFLADAKTFYEAEILSAKFQDPKAAEKQINDYVEKKTHGKIVELVKDLDPDTVLVVINYLFFKGSWEKPFDPQLTREEDFFVDQNTTVRVPMMYRMGWFYYYFDQELSCTVVQLDYKGSATSFFVLPEVGKEKELDEALSVDVLTKWAANVKRGTAAVYIPKFNISAKYSLKEPLSHLGITDIFTDHADLTGISAQPLKVSKVTHKAVLTVDERGTEAAAATAAEAIPMSLPPEIKFTNPFVVFIFEKQANSTLFLAKVNNPTLS